MQFGSGVPTPKKDIPPMFRPVELPVLNTPPTPYKGTSERMDRSGKLLAWGPDIIQSGRADVLDQPLASQARIVRRAGSARTLDTYINLVDPGIVNTSRGWNGIGPNWPQVPALFGASQRINPGPIVKNGGTFQQGVPNTARWNMVAYRQYLLGQAIARQNGIYSASPIAGPTSQAPV